MTGFVRQESARTSLLPACSLAVFSSAKAFQKLHSTQLFALLTRAVFAACLLWPFSTLLSAGISNSGTYAGCFRDTGCAVDTRLKAALVQNDPRMTVQRCLDLGRTAGWPYVGLAPGTTPGTSSCFGGDKLPVAAVNPGCMAGCAGNSSERCGDASCQVSVYSGEFDSLSLRQRLW